ncbi:mycofactocin precursor MftA [Agromyces mangrovi Wang et al. 2018]|nr:mycofactocin precursor MftA [Agromyces mangrovi]
MTRTDPVGDSQQAADDVIEADSLVEEVSIDGMCGVY